MMIQNTPAVAAYSVNRFRIFRKVFRLDLRVSDAIIQVGNEYLKLIHSYSL